MKKPFRLGLTGSIGMGKSTTADIFRRFDIPVWDADRAVHRLYAKGGSAVAPLAALWPEIAKDGQICRDRLKKILADDFSKISIIEDIVHPLLAQDREEFYHSCASDLAVFDIPLLFEKNLDRIMDETVLVTAPYRLQRQRVLSRAGMDEHRFDQILSRQMPDADKRARATHIIETLSMAAVEAAVQALIAYIRGEHHA